MIRLSPLLIGLVGCGLLSSDVAQFKLRFPRHDFKVDSADWRVVPGGSLPSVPCSIGCTVGGFCSGSLCSVDCNDTSQTCQVHVNFALVNDYNLAVEAREYQAIADQPVVSVTIDEIFFDIGENSLTVPTPPLLVYFGPMSATGIGDPGVELAGAIDAVAPGAMGRVNVAFVGDGRAVMKRYMDDFHTPFRVLVSGQFVLHGGDATPAGRLVGSVQATAHAGI